MSQKNRGLTREEIEQETKRLASDLAFNARAPVSIQLVGGSHIAFTYGTDDTKKQHHIPIVMNPDTLKSVRNKEQAVKIWRGIGFHELAHHLFPAGPQYKAADKEGFRHLFNLVDDEQNERLGRAMDPSWGACFQSVCAHVFPSKNRNADTLSTGIIDGEKEGKKPRGIAATRIYGQRWNQFAYYFRRHVPDPPDAIVAEALSLIPKRFKDLSKDELLDLTRQVHQTLSRGIELPPEDPEKKAAEAKEDEEERKEQEEQEPEQNDKEEKPDEEEEEEEEQEESNKSNGWTLGSLLYSRWMIVALVLFVLGWSAVLLTGGINFWLQIAIFAGLALIGVITFLFLRRAYIKTLLASIAASATARITPRARAPGANGEEQEGSLRRFFKRRSVRVFALVLLGSMLLLLGLLFIKHFGVALAGLALEIGAIILSFSIASRVKHRAEREQKPLRTRTVVILSLVPALAFLFLVVTVGSIWLRDLNWSWFLPWVVMPLVFLCIIGVLSSIYRLAAAGRSRVNQRVFNLVRVKCENMLSAALRGIALLFRPVVWLFLLLGRLLLFLWRMFRAVCVFVAKWVVRFYWFVEPIFKRLWRHSLFRLAVVALPIATLVVMIYSVLVTAGRTSPWLLVLLIVLLLLLLLLGFLFRKQIRKFVVNELFMPMPSLMDVSMQVPLDMETEWFVQVDNVIPVQPDQAWLDEHLAEINLFAQQLRPYFKRCGRQTVDREDQPDGYDLTDEAELALVGETSVFVNDDTVPKPSVHLEVALDCSSSMSSPTASLKPGEKFLLGKFFAAVLEQAVANLPGVSAHFWGFTDNTIYDCGGPGEGRISGLQCGGGNNDAAMLWHMGQSAAKSGKDVKILIMLSDGQPSECSWLSLHNLVLQFEQEGMIPWNFALDEINVPAFERFFTDLVGQSMEEAIITMGETLASIAQDGV